MKVFKLPDLGEGLPDAEVREWHVHPGDEVKVDQPLVSVETAKAVVDVPAPYAGKIEKLFAKPGEVVKTGEPLISFESKEDSGTVVGSLEIGDKIIEESPTGIKPTHAASKRVKATPAVRALAKKLNINLETIKPTGPGDAITAADVKHAVSEGNVEVLSNVRRAMALNMVKAHAEVVPVTLVDDADINHWPEHTDITAKLVRAITAGCEQVPAINSHFDTPTMSRILFKEVNIGMAVDTGDALYVPVLKDVANKGDQTLRSEIEAFKEQASKQAIAKEDIQGATIMFSNFGTFGGRYASPIVVPPAVAILGVGRIIEAVVAVNGKPTVHKILPLSLSFDHRAITGGESARFLMAVIKHLEAT